MSRKSSAKSGSKRGMKRSKSTRSSDCALSESAPDESLAPASIFRLQGIDAAILALVLGFALLLIASGGFANGQELWPMPDAVEYAAVAVNLDRGLGPVLHFASNSYPSRYTIGYPLILAAAYPVLDHRPERLYLVTVASALIAIAGLYLLTLLVFDRSSAIVAALLLATSPHFLGLSTCVMSDVPALAVVVLAVLAFLYALEKDSLVASILCGLLAGLTVTIRVTDSAILVGMLAAVLLVPRRRLRFALAIAFAFGFIMLPALQALLNRHYLGSIFSNGYAFWLPEFYNSSKFKTFKLSYLVAPADPIYRHGNFVAYALTMLGLDGILGQLNLGTESRTLVHSHYALYPFPVAIFAALGAYWTIRHSRNAKTMRAVYLGYGFLALLLLVYFPYFHIEPRFMLPAVFVVFATAGWGLIYTNRSLMWRSWAGFAVIALDVVLAGVILVETFSRLTAPPPRQSEVVAEALAIQPRLKNAVLVSDISLQWLELITGGEGTEYVGLNSRLYGRSLNEKHLHWLYEKKSQGWQGTVPSTLLLPSGELDLAEARQLAEQDGRYGRPVYLLIGMPLTNDWIDELKRELAQVNRFFSVEMIAHYPRLGLYRLTPR